ncbi:MAG: hypothetical protein HQL22_06285 [Candidatus Omnitrophica bacterium]|nr:hypothetical protein [Candidatus Omnitrophota bacterium]
MKHNEENAECPSGGCTTTNARNVWIAGITVTLLVTLFCAAMFKAKDAPFPAQPVGPADTVLGPNGQQVALPPAACATCPGLPQCFPPAPAGGAQPVAFAPGCAQAVAYTPGCVQQVGFTPGCAQPAALTTAPRATPPVGWAPCPIPRRQMAAGQNSGTILCPQCRFSYNDPNFWNRGYSRCPRCQSMIPMATPGSPGFQQVAGTALTPPPIFRDAVMLHPFRGICENCHVVRPDIAIPAGTTQVPHGFRGVCSNCHTILGLQPVK